MSQNIKWFENSLTITHPSLLWGVRVCVCVCVCVSPCMQACAHSGRDVWMPRTKLNLLDSISEACGWMNSGFLCSSFLAHLLVMSWIMQRIKWSWASWGSCGHSRISSDLSAKMAVRQKLLVCLGSKALPSSWAAHCFDMGHTFHLSLPWGQRKMLWRMWNSSLSSCTEQTHLPPLPQCCLVLWGCRLLIHSAIPSPHLLASRKGQLKHFLSERGKSAFYSSLFHFVSSYNVPSTFVDPSGSWFCWETNATWTLRILSYF
jgi:hypothetical protein